MVKKKLLTVLIVTLTIHTALAADHNPKLIASMLKDSKITFLEGVDYAEKNSGEVTSAKFEVADGKLVLSVYTIPEGLAVEPEKATLTELAGVATENQYSPLVKVFMDKEHIARASVHMTLFQLSKMTFKQVVNRALSKKSGVVIDVRNPMVANKRPVADVIIVGTGDEIHKVRVDLLSGSTQVLTQ